MKKSKLRIVLIETEGAMNLGSVARVMGNFAFRDLALVRPKASTSAEAAKQMSIATYPLLAKATICQTLPEALQGCHWSLGLTRRSGRNRRKVVAFDQVTAEVTRRHAAGQRVALIFGPERTGLSTDDANSCQSLVQIPTSRAHPSMNLAMAVGVTLYELSRDSSQSLAPIEIEPAPYEEVEAMHGHLDELLKEVHFFDQQNRARIPAILRRLFNRAEPTKQEVRIVRGMCRNALNRLRRL